MVQANMSKKLEENGFISAEGRYLLIEDIFLGDLQSPTLSVGTSISLVTVKFQPKVNKSPNQQIEPIDIPSSGPTTPNLTRSFTSPTLPSSININNNVNNNINNNNLEIKKETDTFSIFAPTYRKRSKANISKTNSSLVTKIVGHENLTGLLVNNNKEHCYVFYNVGHTFFWVDIDLPTEPLSQIVFSKAIPTCHDVNKLTRSKDQLDVIIGLSTGDIVWFDPLSNKYCRINKQGTINPTSVTSIKWVPGSETQFIASHLDGTLIWYDKDKDDCPFLPTLPDVNTLFQVTKPNSKQIGKCNPITHWHVSNKSITAFAFSPDFNLLAVVGLDGGLRIIEVNTECYFGGLTCVSWSPDRKYLLTGGQDDLVTIWSYPDRKIVARCQGHYSWVTGVAFDPWRCDEFNYRFGSVGEDMRLLLWDFSPKALPKLKMQRPRRGSQSVHSIHSQPSLEINGPNVHPLISRNQTVMLKPLMAQPVHSDPLCSLVFRDDAIITTCKKGHIKIWSRPKQHSL